MELDVAVPPCPVLTNDEVARRVTLLAELQAALAELGVQSVLARRHKLVLRAGGPWRASGPADPQLHILGWTGNEVGTTDGAVYQFASGLAYPVSDPRGAAVGIIRVRL